VTPTGFSRLAEWVERGYAGEMKYVEQRQAAYEHPQSVLAGVKSIVVLAINYRARETAPASGPNGLVARYARGSRDYHDLLRARLKDLAGFIRRHRPECRTRGVVDTAPLLERDFAVLAGLGWMAKNTMLINRRIGSWMFLAALLTDVELDYDEPHDTAHCGTCTRCLEACPTSAFPEPYVLDAD
jgi:epoxyqueuosine reductase